VISCGVRILFGDEIFVKLVESHVVESAVDDITEISWNSSLWNHLAIKAKQMEPTLALATSRLQQTPDHSFGDIVIARGCGLILLF
jgi:hypothetical protein